MSLESPMYVTGHHRSGKTVLRWLLDAHPNISMSQRTQMWPRFYRAFGSLGDADNLKACIAAMKNRSQIARLDPDWDQLAADFLAGPPTYSRLFALIHQQMAATKEADRWGDQSTNLERYTARILEAHPRARIIHLVRDPFDAFEAFQHKGARRLSGVGTFSAGWAKSARLGAANQRAYPRNYRVVRYEDLVESPQATASSIFEFVDEPFDESLLRIAHADRYDEHRERSMRGWAISSEFLDSGGSLDACSARLIAAATETERHIWAYERIPTPHRVHAACLSTSVWHNILRAVESARLALADDPPRETSSYSPILRGWHRLTDSDRFRQAVKRGWLSPIVKSDLYRTADIKRRQVLVRMAKDLPDFENVRTFTLFVGHNKSGTSLLGGLLDAHERVVLSDEADALKYIDAGVSREELFRILFRASRSEARKGRITARRLGAYAYAVPGQWQGRADMPVVVGDSMSGTTTRKIAARPGLIEAVEECVSPTALRVLQVIRNPFDPISLMVIRGNRSIANSVDHYFQACDRLIDIRERLGEERLRQVYYEDLVRAPSQELEHVAHYLGFETEPKYLEACSALVQRGFEDSRNRIDWEDHWIEEVERRIDEYAFLQGYTFGSWERGTVSS